MLPRLSRQGLFAVVVVASATVLAFGLYFGIFSRAWTDLLGRPGGSMTFRFLLQPTMSVCLAVRDGRKDARSGRKPYLWTILSDPSNRAQYLRDGLKATARLLALAVILDLIYQLMTFGTFYPGEAAIIALLLGFAPYLLVRGPTARLCRWWRHSPPSSSPDRDEAG